MYVFAVKGEVAKMAKKPKNNDESIKKAIDENQALSFADQNAENTQNADSEKSTDFTPLWKITISAIVKTTKVFLGPPTLEGIIGAEGDHAPNQKLATTDNPNVEDNSVTDTQQKPITRQFVKHKTEHEQLKDETEELTNDVLLILQNPDENENGPKI